MVLLENYVLWKKGDYGPTICGVTYDVFEGILIFYFQIG